MGLDGLQRVTDAFWPGLGVWEREAPETSQKGLAERDELLADAFYAARSSQAGSHIFS